ncbi:hypothetical protein NHQ30_000743 [Ciborinia camelliae]|nr:hypothetical protein NHQ30_000743 [Ciborinia camelliae]
MSSDTNPSSSSQSQLHPIPSLNSEHQGSNGREPSVITTPSMSKYCPDCDYPCDQHNISCYFCCFESARWMAIPTRRMDFYDEIAEPAMDESKTDTFTCFSGLPTEIRLRIWMYALPGPRIVYLYIVPSKHPQETPFKISHTYGALICSLTCSLSEIKSGYAYKSPSTISLLYVCHEAHNVVRKFYTKAFATEDSSAKTWFDFKIDTLLIDCWTPVLGMPYIPEAIWCPDFKKVRQLATSLYPYVWQRPGYVMQDTLCHETFKKFPNVKVFSLIHRRYKEKHLGDLEFLDPIDIDTLLTHWSELPGNIAPLDEAFHEKLRLYGSLISQITCLSEEGIYDAQAEDDELWDDEGRISPPYQMPLLQRKIITTSAMATRVKKALVNYERSQAPNLREKMKIHEGNISVDFDNEFWPPQEDPPYREAHSVFALPDYRRLGFRPEW